MSSYVDKTLNINCNESLKLNLMIEMVFHLNIFFINTLTTGFAFPKVRILFVLSRNT